MAMAYQLLLALLPYFFLIVGSRAALTAVDDGNSSLRYSNSGPSWKFCTPMTGGGDYVLYVGSSYWGTWHEARGDGASVSLTLTGTRVVVNGTVATSMYNSVIDFYVDDQLVTTYNNNPPPTPRPDSITGWNYRTTLADIPLSPAQHTVKAVTRGADSLFVFDSISYEPSDAAPSSVAVSASDTSSTSKPATSSSSTSSSSSSASTTSTTNVSSTTSMSQTQSSSTPSNGQPVILGMDMIPSDSRIVYTPASAWSTISTTKRAGSCLDGIKTSSTPGSYFSVNFTGTSIQLWTVSSPTGGKYSITLDGQPQPTYDTQNAAINPSGCTASSLYSVDNLSNAQHTLVFKVESPSIEFAGLKTSSTSGVGTTSDEKPSNSNVGAIVGGVIGGVALLAIIILAVFFALRKATRNETTEAVPYTPSSDSVRPFDINAAMNEVHRKNSLTRGAWRSVQDAYSTSGSTREHMDSSGTSQHLDTAESGHRQQNYSRPLAQQSDFLETGYPSSGSRPINPPELDGESLERLTYYTLPSYHERLMQHPGTRDLSESDRNAISRRLAEVLQTQGAAHDPNLMPPELIEHLVEEQLRPREAQRH